MVKQGDIIKLDFTPQSGHEQSGYRPAVVISNDFFNLKTNLAIVCPITNTKRPFPLHVPLDARTETTGIIMCEQIGAAKIRSPACFFRQTLEPIPLSNVRWILVLVAMMQGAATRQCETLVRSGNVAA